MPAAPRPRTLLWLCLLALALALATWWDNFRTYRFVDFHLRYDEIACSHTGTNPFDVWDQRTVHPLYKGHPRPDREPDPAPKRQVHAYPPWHTTYCWFYAYLPRTLLAWGFAAASLLALAAVLASFRRYAPSEPLARATFLLFILAGIAPQAANLLGVGNYGALLLGLICLLFAALERGRSLLAALCWALIMTKPQVGLLLFWPLLWSKERRVIPLAIAIVLLATCFPAWLYHLSPLELLRQIPQTSAPYLTPNLLTLPGIVQTLFGSLGAHLWMAACFLLCGALSWRVRHTPHLPLRFAPALALFPFWTYSQFHDHVLVAYLYLLLALVHWRCAPFSVPERARTLLDATLLPLLLALVAMGLWSLLLVTGLLQPAGNGWLYRLAALLPAYLPPAFTLLLCLCQPRRKTTLTAASTEAPAPYPKKGRA